MPDIQRLGQDTVIKMAEALTRADAEGKAFRIHTGRNDVGTLFIQWKVGQGTWTLPHYAVNDR